jgi:predicted TIM-barrel fold metal-dependent hydrolase
MQAAYFAWLADGVVRHPDVHVVFAVLAGGAPIQLERVRSRGSDPGTSRHPRIHLDTASFSPSALRLCLETLGPEHLVFGSDVPVIDARPTLRALAEMGEATLAAARSENPGRLFR